MINVPKSFKLKVDKPGLLRKGLPYAFHEAYKYDYVFKTLNISNGEGLTTISAKKQNQIYHDLCTKKIMKPIIVGIGAFPTDKGCNATAASLLYHMQDSNLDFRIYTFSTLLVTPREIEKITGETPEIICLMDLDEECPFGIENAKAIISAYRNSVLILPAVTQNIIDFLRNILHKTGIYLQFSSLKRTKTV